MANSAEKTAEISDLKQRIASMTLEEKLLAIAKILASVSPENSGGVASLAEGDRRKNTARFYQRNTSKARRQRLNDIAANLLEKIEGGMIDAKDLTDEQKVALAHYSGCGGGLIGPDGKKGSDYEYYTPKAVAEGVWDAVKALGFNGGKVLDPCAGVGIFGATSPRNCAVDACELSPYSGKINSILNDGPGYRTHIGPFEEFAAAIPDNSYDAVVSNVPFCTDKAARGGNQFLDPQYQDHPIDSYFILKALRKLRPGGIAALIAPVRCVGTAGGNGGKMREMRVESSALAEFIGAYRLPSGTFGDAQTETVTDVIFYRKYSEPVLKKIEELREQNPTVLVQANVFWDTYLDGRYFDSAEGKRYIFGTEGVKKGRFGDTYAVTFDSKDGKVDPAAVKDLMHLKRLPGSRINWSMLEAAETTPITYKEGDVIVQGGATLVMTDGEWVVQKANYDKEMGDALGNIETPYRCFENKISWDDAKRISAYFGARCANLELPTWFRSAMNELGAKTERQAATYWKRGIIALSCEEVQNNRASEIGFNFLEGYPALSKAMKTSGATIADGQKFGGNIGGAIAKLGTLYHKIHGYSDTWTGNIQKEIVRTEQEETFRQTDEARLANAQYERRSIWLNLDDVKAIKGKDFDPFSDDTWAMNADGKICEALDFYSGNYGDFIKQMDAEIERCKDEKIKAKLIRQKASAADRVRKPNVSNMTFDLRSPFITPEEKVEFLRLFGFSPKARVEGVGDTKRIKTFSKPLWGGVSREDKLQRCFENYFENFNIRIGNNKFYDSRGTDPDEQRAAQEEALEELKQMVKRANVQFNTWVRSNQKIMDRIANEANDPKNCYFEYLEDTRPIDIPGIRKDDGKGNPIKLHDYQTAFVRKMGRGFEGINAFGTGLGKTFTALAAVQHVQSIGAKNKTLFVVPKSVFSNWKKEATWVYTNPENCLFVGMRKGRNGKEKVDAKAVIEDFNAIKDGRYSKIFMTLEAFQRLRLKEETVYDYLEYMKSNDESFSPSLDKKKDERAENRRKAIAKTISTSGIAAAPYIEDLGIDSLVIDEAHFLKNSLKAGNYGQDVASLPMSEPSSRGIDAMAKAWYFRKISPKNDGVLMLTATPITNSPLEIYSMLSMAVGIDRVNSMLGGKVGGSDSFMETVCRVEPEEHTSLTNKLSNRDTFVGFDNLELLRGALHNIAVFKDAEALGKANVGRDEKVQKVTVPGDSMSAIRQYRNAYSYAKHKLTNNLEKLGNEPDFEQIENDYLLVAAKFKEPDEIIGSAFNLLRKMQMEISDPELTERAVFYDIDPSQADKVKALLTEWNEQNVSETSMKISQHVAESDIIKKPSITEVMELRERLGKDVPFDENAKNDGWSYYVRAAEVDGNRIRVNAQSFQIQDNFEKLAEKHGVSLGCRASAKQAALIGNIKAEMANPRGLISRDPRVVSPIVKQIVFCDDLSSHCKVRRLISQKCGIPASKIAIVTGQTNGTVDEILDVQNGFNAQGEDNVYQLIIANKKAEVGINLQKGTQAIHHLTIGWTPDSIAQRDGRGVRQGNATESVNVYFYDAENTFDEVKRSMVNKKGDWIGSVANANGGNSVQVAQRFTNKDYEALADLSTGDPDAVKKYVERRQNEELAALKERNKESQRINLETIKVNRHWLQMNETDENVVASIAKDAAQAGKEYRDLERLANADGKMSDTRRRALIDEAQKAKAKYEELMDLVRASFERTATGGELGGLTLERLVFELENHSGGVISLFARYGWQPKAESPATKIWRSKKEAAENMINGAIASFKAVSEQPGGQPAAFADAAANGTLREGSNGVPVVSGCFITTVDGGFYLINDHGAVCAKSAWGDDSKFVGWSSHYIDRLQISDVFCPGDDGYEDCLKRAGDIESQVIQNANTPDDYRGAFSQFCPEVSRFVSATPVHRYQIGVLLLPTTFPCPILKCWVDREDHGLLSDLAKEQSAFIEDIESEVRRINPFRSIVRLSKIEGVTFLESYRVNDERGLMLRNFEMLMDIAKSRGVKLSLNDFFQYIDGKVTGLSIAFVSNYIRGKYLSDNLFVEKIVNEKIAQSENAGDLEFSDVVDLGAKALAEWAQSNVSEFDWEKIAEDHRIKIFGHSGSAFESVFEGVASEIMQKRREKETEAMANTAAESIAYLDTTDRVVVTETSKGGTYSWNKTAGFKRNFNATFRKYGVLQHPEYGENVWVMQKGDWLRFLTEYSAAASDLIARPYQ